MEKLRSPFEDEPRDERLRMMSNTEMMGLLDKKGMSVPDYDYYRVTLLQRRYKLIREPITDIPLHIITPVTRPHLLQNIVDSITNANQPHRFIINWHCIFKNHENRYNVIQLHNKLLDGIKDGWVHFMCDDNSFHPEIFTELQAAIDTNPNMGAFVVGIFGRKGRTIIPTSEHMVPWGLDAAQCFIERKTIGKIRYDTGKTPYTDSRFIMDVYEKNPEKVVFSEKILSYYERTIRDENGCLIKQEIL